MSELVGKFVPDTDEAAKFRFAEGAAPSAMREGAWLVMDELDLAPTEIGERCNSMLEMPYPSLHLAEHRGETIEAHPGFRALATFNGTGYAGRQELSPAFLDRWKIRACAAPAEADYRALAECLVHGHQPDVVVNGARYTGGAGTPAFPELNAVPEIDRFLVTLVRFHAGIAAMAQGGELRARGASRTRAARWSIRCGRCATSCWRRATAGPARRPPRRPRGRHCRSTTWSGFPATASARRRWLC